MKTLRPGGFPRLSPRVIMHQVYLCEGGLSEVAG